MACCFEFEHVARLDDGCQFKNLPSEVGKILGDLNREYEFEGRTWCVFHLPLNAKEKRGENQLPWSPDEIDQFNSAVEALIKGAGEQRKICDFSGVVFPADMNFHETTFPLTLFSKAIFGGPAILTGCVFKSRVWFKEAEFYGIAWFDDADFATGANFQRVHFHESALFPFWGEFIEVGRKRDAHFPELDFEDAIFDGLAIFTNRPFILPADFRVQKFAFAPNFFGCDIHEGTLFPGREAFSDVSGDAAALAYSKLKNDMARFKRTDDEAMFYALELESKLNSEKTPESVKWAIRMYKWTADYGQSFTRPLIWLAGLAASTLLIFALFALYAGEIAITDPIQFAITLSLEQIFRPFAIWGSHGETLLCDYGWGWQLFVKLVAAVQSAASIGLIALALFALRWRFKRP